MSVITAVEFISLTINLIAFGLAVGLMFAVLVQPRRNNDVYVFVLYLLMIVVAAVTSMIYSAPQQWLAFSVPFTLRLHATALALIVLSYYAFVMNFIKPGGRVVYAVTGTLPVIALAALGIIWLTDSLEVMDRTAGSFAQMSAAAYALLSVGGAVLGFLFWLILSSGHNRAAYLRVPTVLMIGGFATNAIDPLRAVPLDTLLVTLAAVRIGWVVLRFQVFNPLNELNEELRVANRDLRQVVTDLENAKNRAEKLNEELRAANQYKSEFLANMSHELRTPLNSIIGYSELLQNGIYGQLNEKQSDRLEKIYRNGKQLLGLISDILDLNKIDAGKMRLDTDFFDIAPIIDNVMAEFRAQIETKGLTHSRDIEPELPRLYGDPLRVRQIIYNVLSNAVKFTAAGGIEVSARRIQVQNGMSKTFPLPTIGWLRDGAWVIVSVKDTGIGIAPEDQARIFEEFSQVDGSHTREFGGTGLGLAIAKKLVILHDGAIWVRSRPGEGSLFHIAIPADVRDSDTRRTTQTMKAVRA